MTSPAPSSGHAFLSYVREDSAVVDRLQRILVASGVPVWRDTDALWPGEDWREKIRQAVADDSLAFIACFSPASVARAKSYQNEELILAVEQIRLRAPGRPWLIPVRLGDCEPPDYDLGGGRRLSDLQRVDLFPEEAWDVNVIKLVQSVQRILSASVPPPVVVAPPSSEVAAPALGTGGEVMKRVKSLLREPTRQIDLEDEVLSLAATAREQLTDLEQFPTSFPRDVLGGSNLDHTRYLVAQTLAYWSVVEPLAGALVAGCGWGLPEQDAIWTRAMQAIARTAAKELGGHSVLLSLRRFPTVPLLYAGALSAVHRGRYDALRAIAVDAHGLNERGERPPVISEAYVWLPFEMADYVPQVLTLEVEEGPVPDDVIAALHAGHRSKRFTPVSDALFHLLRPLLDAALVDDTEYEDLFDRTEVLLGVIAEDSALQGKAEGVYRHGAWFGRYTWRHRFVKVPIEQAIYQEFTTAGAAWPPITAGLFGGSTSRAEAAFAEFLPTAASVRANRH